MSIPRRKRNGQAARQAAYEKKIALLREGYLERKPVQTQETTKEDRRQEKKPVPIQRKFGASVPVLIAKLPNRTHRELLQMYSKCAENMAGRRPEGISPKIRSLHDAIIAEWRRRYDGLIAGEKGFVWPTTEAPMGDGELNETGWPTEGMLSALGYHVGETSGLTEDRRRFLLDQLFCITLPPLNDLRYMQKWGYPRTPERLRCLAETIAAHTRNAKRRQSRRLDAAISDWESDLDYLYEKYYVGHFHFAWPSTG